MTATTLQRLLKYPHPAVFSKDPQAALVLRVRHEDGCVWRVAEGLMTVTVGGIDEFVYDLKTLTVGQLSAALVADGLDVIHVTSRYDTFSALVLVEGGGSSLDEFDGVYPIPGDQWVSNGDHVYAYTSLLWALMSSYEGELTHAGYQVRQALRQMVMTQAEGEWLDVWAMIYGLTRLPGETDAELRVRIPEEAFRLRVNGLAIEQAVKSITGRSIEIREPWRLMFRLDESALSGADHLHDADFYSYHIIQPVAREAFDWAPVLDVINRNRAAGVLVYSPAVEFPGFEVTVQPPVEYLVRSGRVDLMGCGAWPGGEVPLGVMRLDDNEFTLNHPAVIFELRTFGSDDGLQTAQDFGNHRTIAYAAITLSDGVPLGDENAILSRGQNRYLFDPERTLSDELAPSDYDVTLETRRVERITIETRADGLTWPDVEAIVLGSAPTFGATASAYDGVNNWIGPWNDRSWLGWRLVGMKYSETPWVTEVRYSEPVLGDVRLDEYEPVLNHPLVVTQTPA